MLDLLLILVYLSVGLALAAVAWSVWRGWRCRSRVKREETIARHTQLLTVLFLLAVMALSLVCASAEPLTIGAELFADALWLRVADMFVTTIGVLVGVLLLTMLLLWMRRKLHSLRR